jgi:hypothetical protein
MLNLDSTLVFAIAEFNPCSILIFEATCKRLQQKFDDEKLRNFLKEVVSYPIADSMTRRQ